MRKSSYLILGVLGGVIILYEGLFVMDPLTHRGLLMLFGGLVSLGALLLLWGFPKAIRLSGILFILVGVLNFILLNSIFTAILPSVLGILLVIRRGQGV